MRGGFYPHVEKLNYSFNPQPCLLHPITPISLLNHLAECLNRSAKIGTCVQFRSSSTFYCPSHRLVSYDCVLDKLPVLRTNSDT